MIWAPPVDPIISVNGPPGTGKTMLLKELLTEIVINRAAVLANIEDIGTAPLFEVKAGWKGAGSCPSQRIRGGLPNYRCFE